MEKVLIIAEAGVNHNGSLDNAKRLVDVAKDSGADIVKFQTAKLESLVTKYAPTAKYQQDNIGRNETQREMLKRLLLSYDDFIELAQHCKKRKIEFLSTAFDIESIDFLDKMVNWWKIPSGEITNLPYLRKVALTKKKVILSTGMSTLDEVQAAINILKEGGTTDITVLHCNTQYPTPYEDVNLKAMVKMGQKLQLPYGYSDHTEGVEVSIAAVALGATVIEKHFTLDKNMEGPDHKASLEPHELKAMVKAIRHIELSQGNGEKKPTESEKENIGVARKSIVAKKGIKKGEVFTAVNLTTKRPGTGISPMKWDEVIGKTANKDYEMDEMIEL